MAGARGRAGRQNLVLDEAGIEDPVVFEEQAGTSSRLHPLQRPKFRELLTYARPGDTVHISEMFRLVRGTQHILDVLDILHRDRLALRIHDGAFSAMDLTARHPRTGELLSTVKFMVQTLAAAGELQRDLQRELTYDGLRAAEAKGNKGGRRPVVTAAKAAAVRAAYQGGQSIAALARDHHVSRGAIRTAVVAPDAPAPELLVVLDMPGKVADFLRTASEAPVSTRPHFLNGVTGAWPDTPCKERPELFVDSSRTTPSRNNATRPRHRAPAAPSAKPAPTTPPTTTSVTASTVLPGVEIPTKAAFTMPTRCDGDAPPAGVPAGRSSARCRFLRRGAGRQGRWPRPNNKETTLSPVGQ